MSFNQSNWQVMNVVGIYRQTGNHTKSSEELENKSILLKLWKIAIVGVCTACQDVLWQKQ